MKGMDNDSLVKLVDVVIADALLERAEANHRGDTNAPTVTDMAKRVLAALGLDDLDAAIERVRQECATGFYQMPHELLPYDVKARRIMATLFPDIPAAAFLATEGGEASDG